MKNHNILITATDHAKLRSIVAAGALFDRSGGESKALQSELERAEVLSPEDIPPDVITMNSRAELLDLETGEHMEFALVLPSHANIDDGKISILAPLGTAMLGYRVGDEFEWPVPFGMRRLKVLQIHFQPEAALSLDN
ncbi:MAG: nucleoside diphosphate kinase regulator [Verrucomicrobiaceae bacterium]|nr:MAG: nucleoside diphosphate kinase regulator [Verrucomicrobiaceae bacterium]